MTIEMSLLAPASPGPNPADSQSVKSSSATGPVSSADSKTDDKDSTSGPGGFNAILTSVGQKSEKETQATDAKKVKKADPAEKTSTGATAANAQGAAPVDPAQTQAQVQAQALPAALATGTLPPAATQPNGDVPAQVVSGVTSDARKLVIGSVADAANAERAAGLTDVAPESAGPQGAAANALARGKTEKNALLADSGASTTLAVAGESGASGAPAASGGTAEVQAQFDLKMFAAMQEQRGAQSASMPPVTAFQAAGKPEKPGGDSASSGKGSADSTYSAQSLGVSSNNYASNAPAATESAQGHQVAEQVKYWISQDVQNAQIKLDGLGSKPVEVSISMSGNEAHVAFRTDELQTRGVLENAGTQLKDMLQSQGLVLSGVSVGTSGSGNGGAGDPKSRQSSRQGVVNVIVASPAVAGPSTGQAAGRSLDLFV